MEAIDDASRDDDHTALTNEPTHWVGIGASAGGLEALEDLIKNMPDNTGMTFIVVQHLSPDYKSMMAELLSRKTRMKVLQIEDGMAAEANCIYLIPPRKNLEIFHSRLVLTEQVRDADLNLPIDIFFRSLALDQKKKAIGIVLSGTGSDGALGVRAIKEQGGMVMVQNYATAKFDGMPKSAIATGLVDYVLDADKMSDALVKYVKHPLVANANDAQEMNKEETDFVKILSLIRSQVGVDFSFYKPKTIIRRIEHRISVNQFQNIDEYIQFLLKSKKECEILAKEFLIGVTQFFRDHEAFKILEKDVIPKLFQDYEKRGVIRLWSAGCSTGEEAYSVAILCKEYMERNHIQTDLKIFATDMDKNAIKYAGIAAYPESIISDVSQERLRRFFTRSQGTYWVNDQIRQMVIFSNHNLIANPPFSKIGLVVCRNLLIYLKPEMQKKVLGLFQYSLTKGGYLFLGGSESLSGVSDAFEVINSKWKIFKHRKGQPVPELATLIDMRSRDTTPMRSSLSSFKPSLQTNPHLIQRELYERVSNYFAPAGVIVDDNNMIVHFFKDVKRYFHFPEGQASFNLMDLIDPQLSLVVSNILYRVRKDKTDVIVTKLRFVQDDHRCLLNLEGRPVVLKKVKQEYVILSITQYRDERPALTDEAEHDFDFDEQASERIQELERELQYRDENLQTTVEELETSNEELQATNEELVSSNEELQSTNEELQSVNEELHTVNSQYQEKINELTTLNNDINSLLNNTHIGTLFLDSRLRVRKFTPEITRIINVMEADIGRPFTHLTCNCDYDYLYQDVNEVMDNLNVKEIEIKTNDDEWYLLKIQPNRHSDRSVHGVLLTQVNITALKQTEISLKESERKLKEAQKLARLGNWELDIVNNQLTWSDEVYRIFDLEPQEFAASYDAFLAYVHPDDREKVNRAYKDSLKNKRIYDVVHRLIMKSGEIKYVNERCYSEYDEKGKAVRSVGIVQDISDLKKAENLVQKQQAKLRSASDEKTEINRMLRNTVEKLELSEKKYQRLFNTLSFGFAYHKIITDERGAPVDYEFIDTNTVFEELTGLKKQELVGRTVKQLFPDIEDFWIERYGRVALNGETHQFEHYSKPLDNTFRVKAYSPEKGFFAALFEAVGDPK